MQKPFLLLLIAASFSFAGQDTISSPVDNGSAGEIDYLNAIPMEKTIPYPGVKKKKKKTDTNKTTYRKAGVVVGSDLVGTGE